MRTLALAISLIWLAGTLPLGAAAQDSNDEEARALFDAAEVAYSNGEFDRALDYFQQAYELSGRPGLLFNIAAVHDREHRDQEALEIYQRFLEAVPGSPRERFVRNRIEALEAAIAESTPAPAVDVDDLDAAGAGETSVPETSVPETPATETSEPETTEPSTDPVASEPLAFAGEAPEETSRESGVSIGGVALLAVGGALVLGAVGTLVYTLNRNDAIDECNEVHCTNGQEVVDQRDLGVGLTAGLGAAGAAALVVGAVLMATHSSESDESEGAALRCAPSLGGLACAGRF